MMTRGCAISSASADTNQGRATGDLIIRQCPYVRYHAATGRGPSEFGLLAGAEPLAKVGVEGSNPFARSSPFPTKLSPPFPDPPKSPTAAGFCVTGLGVRERNDTAHCSPKAFLSKLGACPIYSTSFFVRHFRSLASLWNRNISTRAEPRRVCRRLIGLSYAASASSSSWA